MIDFFTISVEILLTIREANYVFSDIEGSHQKATRDVERYRAAVGRPQHGKK